MRFLFIPVFLIFISNCNSDRPLTSYDPEVWETRRQEIPDKSRYTEGTTYLSVYSQVYQLHENKTYDLTATVSIRNMSDRDTLFIKDAVYYDKHGNLIRKYLDKTVYVRPLETVEIVINETDNAAGSGAKFIFHWARITGGIDPHFEAVMISTTGQQGLSFVTTGIQIRP